MALVSHTHITCVHVQCLYYVLMPLSSMQPNTIPPHNTTLYTNTITHNHPITVLIHLLLSISVHIVTVPTSLLSFKIPVPHTPSPQYHVHINIINTCIRNTATCMCVFNTVLYYMYIIYTCTWYSCIVNGNGGMGICH